MAYIIQSFHAQGNNYPKQDWCFTCGDDIEPSEAEYCMKCHGSVCEGCLMENCLCPKCNNGRSDN